MQAGKVITGGATAPAPGDASIRSPSASLGFAVMSQLQFIATLSLVASVRDTDSLLAPFVDNLR